MPCGWSGVIFPSTPPFPPRQRQRMTKLILLEILAVPAERSRGRHNPRVVKRKMSSFPTKARAAPSPRRAFRYGEHVRVIPNPADQCGGELGGATAGHQAKWVAALITSGMSARVRQRSP